MWVCLQFYAQNKNTEPHELASSYQTVKKRPTDFVGNEKKEEKLCSLLSQATAN